MVTEFGFGIKDLPVKERGRALQKLLRLNFRDELLADPYSLASWERKGIFLCEFIKNQTDLIFPMTGFHVCFEKQ